MTLHSELEAALKILLSSPFSKGDFIRSLFLNPSLEKG
jgi:hypothetical protein